MQDHVITRAVFSGLFSVCRLKVGRGPLLGKAIEFFTAQGGHAAGAPARTAGGLDQRH